MRDDVKKYIYGTLIIFVVGVLIWLSIVFVNACGFSLACTSNPVDRTPIPTLIPAKMPAQTKYVAAPASDATATALPTQPAVAKPSNPGGPGEAVTLTGDAETGKIIFVANCAACHGPEGKGGMLNSGAKDGVIPALNPVPKNLKDSNPKTFAENIALFVQHGSTPVGMNPVFSMPAWGDAGTLSQQQIADVIAYVISLNP